MLETWMLIVGGVGYVLVAGFIWGLFDRLSWTTDDKTIFAVLWVFTLPSWLLIMGVVKLSDFGKWLTRDKSQDPVKLPEAKVVK